ncbi:hypothetical protein ScPMuIL_002996 [Solemya velum]
MDNKQTHMFGFAGLLLVLGSVCVKNAASLVSVTCEHQTARLSCSTHHEIHIVSVNYGRTDGHTCPHPSMSNTHCYSGTAAANVVKNACEGRESCSVLASNHNMQGDPCVGTFKYLRITYECVASLVSVTCEHKTAHLSCPVGKEIHIAHANYGRTDRTTCPHSAMSNTNCHSGPAAANVVKNSCDGRNSCSVLVNNNNMQGDPCVGTFNVARPYRIRFPYLSETGALESRIRKRPPAYDFILELVYQTMDNKQTHMFGFAGLLLVLGSVCVKNAASLVSVTCEHQTARLSCSTHHEIHIVSVNYGRTDRRTCPHPSTSNTHCYSGTAAANVVKNVCEGRESCSVFANNQNMQGDPCVGTFKYLRITYECVASLVSVTCEHKTAHLSCPVGKEIHIAHANYGRTDVTTCPHSAMSNTNCHSGPAAANVVKNSCDGRNSCSVLVNNNNMQGDPCVGTFKYLNVDYHCT